MSERWDLAATARKLGEDSAETQARHAIDRQLIRADLSHWELAELFSLCLPLALHHVVWCVAYPDFRARWIAIFGDQIAPHLLSLYLAAATSARIEREEAIRCVAGLSEGDFQEES